MKAWTAVAVAFTWAALAAAAADPVPADEPKAPAKKAAKPAAAPKKKPASTNAAAPKKAAAPAKAKAPPIVQPKDPNVRIYKAGAPDAPKLRDKDGNVIPTSPDAYDVSSARKK